MMLQQQGVPGLIGNSGDGDASEAGGGILNEEEKGRSEESERNSGGGSRWPRQETIALLKIRSDMDVAFRDSSLKGPLWDEVSRKLTELGYRRSAKKCKEKFENVYKYHKRTKDGRNTKSDGKTYRFFEQLEALDTHPSLSLISSSPMKSQARPTILTSTALLGNSTSNMNTNTSPVITVSSNPSPISTFFPSNAIHPINFSSFNIPPQPTVSISPTVPTQKPTATYSNPNMSFSTSSTSSDEQPERFGKRKRKWEDFFGRLMSEVMKKQDELQLKFLDTLEKRERDRMAREEARRVQEMAKMNQERERLLRERSMAAAKDAAVISFLQKITEQQQNSPNVPITIPPILTQIQAQPNVVSTVLPPRQPGPIQVSQPAAPTAIVSAPAPVSAPMRSREDGNLQSSNYNDSNENNTLMSPSPSRWPKAEVQALIKLRTTLDTKYNENGAKGPLWEEISGAMRKIGYNRNAKRCKEKWENINKYYKKVKESSKKRPEDAKTCPYFHQLEAIHKDKNVTSNITNPSNPNPVLGVKPENPMTSVPIMPQYEQQWPLQQEKHKEADNESENMDDPNLDDDYEDDDEDDGAGYEIVTNKQQQQQQARAAE